MAAIGHGVNSCLCVFFGVWRGTKNKEESKNVNVSYPQRISKCSDGVIFLVTRIVLFIEKLLVWFVCVCVYSSMVYSRHHTIM